MVTGLQYVKDNRPDNVPRLTAKFRKGIEYLRRAFKDYKHEFMLWSPVVKNQRAGAKYNQIDDIRAIVETIKNEFGVVIEPIINKKFMDALGALRGVARDTTRELDSHVLRFLQVEEHLKKHLNRLGPEVTS